MRVRILIDHADQFNEALRRVTEKFQTTMPAWVLLPDHVHLLMDVSTENLSEVVHCLKLSFSSRFRKAVGWRRGTVWQSRFWDHVIRDEVDYRHHVDYIHFNPVKHGYVCSPFDWKHSTAREHLRRGVYAPDWGMEFTVDPSVNYGE